MKHPDLFTPHDLGGGHAFWIGTLPPELRLTSEQFQELWRMHPAEYHEIKIHGRLVKIPRWQQAYGVDYNYTGRVNAAQPVPDLLKPILAWTQSAVDQRLNGILVNWYDGSLRHYIGRHRDSIKNMIVGGPIVTISFGDERVFRIRPWPNRPGGSKFDFRAADSSVYVMGYETNRAFTHEVPPAFNSHGRRISITVRAFEDRQTHRLVGVPGQLGMWFCR